MVRVGHKTYKVSRVEDRTGAWSHCRQKRAVRYDLQRKVSYPKVLIGTDAYNDGDGGGSSDEHYHYVMADRLVYESCHDKQVHDLRRRFLPSKNAAEEACHTAALDALKQMDGPQELIDWNQDIIDNYKREV
jgi:hypothetical protein